MKPINKKLLKIMMLTTVTIYANSITVFAEDEYSNYNIEVDDSIINFNGSSFHYNGVYSQYINGKSGIGNVFNNNLTFNGGNFSFIINSGSYFGNFRNNTISLINGTLSINISDFTSYSGNINSNEININGGTYNNSYNLMSSAIASSNIVNISGSPNLSNAYIYGGVLGDVGDSLNNTLNIRSTGLTAKNIYDFQNINFYLPSNIANDDKVLTLTDGKTDISGVDRIYAQVPGDTSLTNGNKVYLIHNNNGINGEAANNYAEMAVGVSTQYTVKIEKSSDGNSVLMLVGDAEESNDSGNSGSSNNGNSGSSDSGNSGSDNGNNSSNTSGDSSSDSGNSGSSDNGNSGSDNGNSSSDNSSTTNNTASNNVITVNDSNYTIKHADDAEQTSDYNGNRNNVIGGQVGSNLSNSDIVGGTSDSGDSTNNQITINAGTFNQDIKGGYAPGNSASDNTINIRGGHFNGDIIGGEGSTTNNNTIDISGNPTFSNNTIIYGGKINNSSRNYVEGGYIEKGDEIANESSGNTLNIRSVGLTAQNIGNFNNLNFYIPESATNGDTMLTLSDTSGTDLSNTSIKAGVTGDSYLQTGDRVNLLTNENGLTTTGTSYGQLTAGVSADFDVAVAQAGNSIVATITRKTTNPETRIFDIPPIEVPHLLNKGTDQLIHDFDFDDINPQEMPNQNSFLLNSGGHNDRIKTGSGSILRSRGTNHNLGYARSFKNSAGTFTIIPVVEYGHGSYDTYLSNDMHGDGSAKYVAGGFIARQFNNSGLYYEGSFRAGRSEFDFGSSGFENYDRVSYKTHAPVFASHLRLGYLTKINPKNILHVYGIYSYSRQNSMDAHLSSGETYAFDSIDSNRFRAGYKWTSKVSPISYVYTGMAYMYESNPNSNAMYKNQNLRVPKAGASGSSGMLELGWQIRPLKNNPWMVDINTTGWIGHQKGITALAKIKKAF
ncbi:MAG: hypothetical protein IJ563_12140 [Selenomonadaceae bacterium]|nr:hypothetical protein [Selenomonadaceae bacterium]MBR1859030.1 hypothetical protein [Selenomonadaceae bacterium]